MSDCKVCLHKKVCSKFVATGGHVSNCEHFIKDIIGYWLPQKLLGQAIWDCSNCKTIGSPHWKRCPVCEARMTNNDLEA